MSMIAQNLHKIHKKSCTEFANYAAEFSVVWHRILTTYLQQAVIRIALCGF